MQTTKSNPGQLPRPDGQGFTPYWLNIPIITGDLSLPLDGEIVIIGSGLSGVSTAYFLQKYGFNDITVVDFEPEKSATFRNCGHILYGAVESMQALVAIHGHDLAKEIWGYSIEICHQVRNTIKALNLRADYKQDGYLCLAIDETELQELQESIKILTSMGYHSRFVGRAKLEKLGFKNIFGGRFEPGSAQAHPVKFRNGLMRRCLNQGLKYHSGCKVTRVSESSMTAVEITINGRVVTFDAAVIAANAYSPLFSDFVANRHLVEPFKGQILCSAPLRHSRLPVTYPHSFDHGYEYALSTPDNRLIMGGWRNHTPTGETGSYDITPNPLVDKGLMDFVTNHYQLKEKPQWERSWAGIMAASRTGFPFVGPTNSPTIYCCAGFTGHGLSWAHGCAHLLAKIMAGKPIPSISRHFNPNVSLPIALGSK